VVELVVMAANALVQAIVTDGWEGVRHKIASLFGRGQADPKIEQKIDATRAQLISAAPGELGQLQEDLGRDWAVRFNDLLADYPDAEAELAKLVEEIRAGLRVTATGHSLAAGRDVKITAEGGSVAAGVIHGNVAPPNPT
jgi:hypothetical protein